MAKKAAKKKVTKKTEVPETNPFEETVQAPPVELPETPPAISVSELQSMVQVINTATTRGAFRGNELTVVGSLYDKLTQFLKYVAETQAENTESKEGE